MMMTSFLGFMDSSKNGFFATTGLLVLAPNAVGAAAAKRT
jgi:hypothetical protein